MPHVIVKMHSGKSEQQKAMIADEVTNAMMKATGHGADAISVSIEDVRPADWLTTVYKPDIIEKPDNLYKKPGYHMA